MIVVSSNFRLFPEAPVGQPQFQWDLLKAVALDTACYKFSRPNYASQFDSHPIFPSQAATSAIFCPISLRPIDIPFVDKARLPPMSYNTDRMSVDKYHSNWQHHFSRYGATLPDNSAVQVDSNPTSGWRGHYMLFGSTCDSDLSNLSQSESCLDAGLFTPESYSVTSPLSPARPSTSTIRWVPDSGGATRPLDQQDAKDKKERRRAQNRVAQRGAHPFFCCGTNIG